MSIKFNEQTKVFTIDTKNSTYQMGVVEKGFLSHLYYGKKIKNSEVDYLSISSNRGFTVVPHDMSYTRDFSLELVSQEYSTFGLGDYRTSALAVINADGSNAVDLRYKAHRIYNGKPKLEGLPALYPVDNEFDTLEIDMADPFTNVCVTLIYSVFAENDIITRSSIIKNSTNGIIKLDRALSSCVDFFTDNYDMITFHGRHAMERQPQRRPVSHGKISVGSNRGSSSSHHNPFVIMCDKHATETVGDCFGFSFAYSGNFLAECEVDQLDNTRFVMGINPECFNYTLEQGECFTTPEVIMCFSANGFSEMSNKYHKTIRNNMCRGKFKNARRPILVNNWEATYFDFDDDKLVDIAKDAADLGIEMLVMDDGWFGKRDDDKSSLGDWFVNEKKIKGGVKPLCERINALGLKAGIWIEPEMVNEDSELYKEHPEWALTIDGRTPAPSRDQLVLDFSRKDVRDRIYSDICKVIDAGNFAYIKWDFNRNLTDVHSKELSADRQGELMHKYVLGLYEMLERFATDYPDIMIEGCSGGGGRFDAGMLYYTPQIWCSDNTDPINRTKIQYGTSFAYPISTVGSHVSAVPNHQTGNTTSMNTRAVVAYAGTFGYELDLNKLTDEEKADVRKHIEFYKENYELINHGDYYRLTNPLENHNFVSWQFVSEDKTKSYLSFVLTYPEGNEKIYYVKPMGLCEDKMYKLEGMDGVYSGSAIMNAGVPVPNFFVFGDKDCGVYTAKTMFIEEVK